MIYESVDNKIIDRSQARGMIEIIQEGSNYDLIQLHNKEIAELKKDLKDGKKLMKKDPDTAISKFESVKKRSEIIKKYIERCDDTSVEKIIGTFAMFIKSYIFDAFLITESILNITSGVSVIKAIKKTGLRPGKPNLDFWKDYNPITKKMELSTFGERELKKYNARLAEYEAKVAKTSLKTANIAYGVSLAMGIAELIKIAIDFEKSAEGAKKLLEKDMDKEHWDRMVTKVYNPLRTYMYQVCDEISVLSDRYIEKVNMITSVMQESVIYISDFIYEAYREEKITEEEKNLLVKRLFE